MQTATEIVDHIRNGATTPSAVLAATFERLDTLEGGLQAFVEIDRDGAAQTAASTLTGPLTGVPVALKDIIDVADLPTRLGAAPFAHRNPPVDAVAVQRLREAGAVIVGKAHTTQFAYLDPAPTYNPWHRDHTPGGSSAGSAAAVGASIVPIALGSQTVGSVLRPAAYCGCVGLKPTFGRIPYTGTAYLAPSFDHLGIICRSVADAALTLSVIAGYDASDPRAADVPVDDYVAAAQSARAPRIALARRFFEGEAGTEVANHLNDIAELLAIRGATVEAIDMPATAVEISDMGQPVLRAEAAFTHFEAFQTHREEYAPNIRALIESGFEFSAVDLLRARDQLDQLRAALVSLLADYDAILMPSAQTTAPTRESTGSGIFCAPASFTGLPAIALPSGISPSGLPFSVQLVSAPFAESRLLSAAAWVEGVLDFTARPPSPS